MEMRTFPADGTPVSLLGFGCMRLPLLEQGKPDIDEAAARSMVEYALAHGVNYFDTAYPYHEGLSESFIGRALSGHPRESYLLASKMPTWLIESPADCERIFAEQLEKCRVDCFDFYLVHNLSTPNYAIMQKTGIYDFLRRKKEEGAIRRLGFSFHDKPELLETITAGHAWDFVQLQLNYLDWEVQNAERQYAIADAAGLPVVVMEPLRGGSLAAPGTAAEEIFRRADPDAAPASWALRYAASLPRVLTVLSGMSALEQVQENVKTMETFRPVSGAEQAVIAQAAAAYRSSGAVPCTGCRYCMDCPAGVDIPKNFAVYNQYRLTGNKVYFTIEYNQILGPERAAARCVECGQCSALCPQAIDIPEQLQAVTAGAAEASGA